MGLLYQVIATGIICFVSLNTGVLLVWPATTIVMFASNDTVLNRPMTETEISLLSSLAYFGSLISTLVAGFLLDKLGRKKSILIIAMSITIIWTILAASKQVEVVLFCAFFSGYSIATFLVGANYISEICQESIRGTMTASNMLFSSIGMTLLYLLGGQMSYQVLIYVGITMNVVSLALIMLLKDSPVYLMKIGQEKEAAEAIAFFRHLKTDDTQIIKEINIIKSSLNPEIEETIPESEKLNSESKPQTENLSFWKFIKKSKSTRQAFLVINIVMIFGLSQGLSPIEINVESLFSEAIPSISPMTCGGIMAGIIVIAGITGAYLTDIVGRRPLIVYGSIATCICCVILGTQFHFHWGPSWITGIFLYVYPVTYTIGAGTVPTVVIPELFLPEVRDVLTTVCIEVMMLWVAISLYVFNPLLNAIGWGPVFYIFAIMSLITAAISYFFLPETKGLTVEEIQPLFQKKRRNHCRNKF